MFIVYKVFHKDLTYIPCGHMAICQNFVKHLIVYIINTLATNKSYTLTRDERPSGHIMLDVGILLL